MLLDADGSKSTAQEGEEVLVEEETEVKCTEMQVSRKEVR